MKRQIQAIRPHPTILESSPHHQERQREGQDRGIKGADVRADAPPTRKNRGAQQGIGVDVQPALDVVGIPQIGQDQTGHIGAGDVGDPEELLRQIGHEETEGQAEHCQPLSPGVAEAHTFKDLVHQIANHPGEEEKAALYLPVP